MFALAKSTSTSHGSLRPSASSSYQAPGIGKEPHAPMDGQTQRKLQECCAVTRCAGRVALPRLVYPRHRAAPAPIPLNVARVHHRRGSGPPSRAHHFLTSPKRRARVWGWRDRVRDIPSSTVQAATASWSFWHPLTHPPDASNERAVTPTREDVGRWGSGSVQRFRCDQDAGRPEAPLRKISLLELRIH